MSQISSFWYRRRCLVTGGIGFIGSHLSKYLHAGGAQVFVADTEAAHKRTLFSILNNGCDIKTIQTDLSEASAVELVQNLQVDAIFHLAGLPYAPYTTRHPREAYSSNVVSAVNMLEAARLSKVRRFVLVSSACVFGASQHSPLEVNDKPYVPEHFYSVTKKDAEKQVHAYHEWYKVGASICRLGNVYGPGDRHFGRIVPQICKQLIDRPSDKLELKRSTGDSVFEFLFVDDAVKALVQAAENDNVGLQTFQFSAGKTGRSSIVDLVRSISETFDGRSRDIIKSSSPEKRVEKYLDTKPTKEVLQWNADWDLDHGLRATVDWYKRNITLLEPHDDLIS